MTGSRLVTKIHRACVGLLTALAVLPGAGHAAEKSQSIDAIEATVRDFLQAQGKNRPGEWDIRIQRLDRRLRLHACRSPLEAFAPHGRLRLSGRTTVGVRCNDAKPWKLYVPVAIDHYIDVVVAQRPLTVGRRIGRDDVATARHNVSTLPHGYFRDPKAVLGQSVRQSLSPGQLLRPTALAEPTLVRRGQELLLVADTGSVMVSMSGIALENGSRGERIRVRNSRSGRVVEGTVLDSNRVGVGTLSGPVARR